MAELDPAVEQQLADMSDQDWRALSARVRPPTSSEHLKNVVSQVLSGHQLDSFMAIADPKKFADANGDIDESKVMGHLTSFFAAGDSPSDQAPNYGQGGNALGPPSQAGDRARAALKRRHGVGANDANKSGPDSRIRPGTGGREALQRRHGKGR